MLSSMRLFADVVQTGSFSTTARNLSLSASSVNRQIAALETHLDTRLINRNTRHHRLTETGQLYIEHVKRILRDIDAAKVAVAELESDARGILRVSAPVGFGHHQIAPAIADFLDSYPQLDVELLIDNQFIDLIDDAVDVAIRIDKLPDSSLRARRLMSIQRVICASPAFLQTHGTPQHPHDLLKMPCLPFHRHDALERSRPEAKVWRLKGPGGSFVIKVSGRIRSNSGDALLAAALKHQGLVLLPRWSLQNELAAGHLVTVLDDYHAAPETDSTAVYAVYPSTRHLSPKVRVFVDFLADRFRPERIDKTASA